MFFNSSPPGVVGNVFVGGGVVLSVSEPVFVFLPSCGLNLLLPLLLGPELGIVCPPGPEYFVFGMRTELISQGLPLL